MALLAKSQCSASGLRLPTRAGAPAVAVARRSPVACKAEDAKSESAPSSSSSSPMGPEWAQPVVSFMAAEDVKLEQLTTKVTTSDLYQKNLKEFAEGPVAAEATGWKKIPETINGRAAMIGFLAGAAAEVFGGGSILNQMAASPQSVVATIALIAVGSLVPIAKGTKGDYLTSLQDTYALPEGVFTEKLEQVHGRLAMTGLVSIMFIELFTGKALL